jgi:hypothetical protein
MRRTLRVLLPFLMLTACSPDALAPVGGSCHSLADCTQGLVCVDARCTNDLEAIAGGSATAASTASADAGVSAGDAGAGGPPPIAMDGGQSQTSPVPQASAGVNSDAGTSTPAGGQRRDAGGATPSKDAAAEPIDAGGPVDGGGGLRDAGSAEMDAEAADASRDATAGNAAIDAG